MSEYDDFDADSEPEEEVGYQPPLNRSMILRIASATTFVAIGAGTLWMAYGIGETPQEGKTVSVQNSDGPVNTVRTAPTAGESQQFGGYMEFAGVGLLSGVSTALVQAARAKRRVARLDGSHDRYDDPLDRRLFEGYCQKITKDVVWVNERIVGSGSIPFDRPDSVE